MKSFLKIDLGHLVGLEDSYTWNDEYLLPICWEMIENECTVAQKPHEETQLQPSCTETALEAHSDCTETPTAFFFLLLE